MANPVSMLALVIHRCTSFILTFCFCSLFFLASFPLEARNKSELQCNHVIANPLEIDLFQVSTDHEKKTFRFFIVTDASKGTLPIVRAGVESIYPPEDGRDPKTEYFCFEKLKALGVWRPFGRVASININPESSEETGIEELEIAYNHNLINPLSDTGSFSFLVKREQSTWKSYHQEKEIRALKFLATFIGNNAVGIRDVQVFNKE